MYMQPAIEDHRDDGEQGRGGPVELPEQPEQQSLHHRGEKHPEQPGMPNAGPDQAEPPGEQQEVERRLVEEGLVASEEGMLAQQPMLDVMDTR